MGVIYTTEQVFLGSDTFEHEQAELMSVKEVADFILTHESGFIRYDDGTPLLEFFDRELHDCTDTCVMTPVGVIDHGAMEETEDEKAFMQNLVPYRYWYTVKCENDIHVDMAECPEDIWDIISSATGQSLEQNGGMCL